MIKKTTLLLAMLLAAAPVMADEDQLVLSVKRLTLDTATRIAQGAIAACREKGIQIGVTVVDRNGIAQVTLRDTLAPTITLGISEGKAAAAANFGVDTVALAEIENNAIGRTPGMVAHEGGVLIQAAGEFLGAVGVSGAQDSAVDAECAKAGVDTVIDDLEMM